MQRASIKEKHILEKLYSLEKLFCLQGFRPVGYEHFGLHMVFQ